MWEDKPEMYQTLTTCLLGSIGVVIHCQKLSVFKKSQNVT